MSALPIAITEPRELRDYQLEAIDLLRGSLRSGHRRPVLQAPTAFGKTVLASHVVRMAMEKGNRIVFTVPAISLIDQTLESFWRDGVADVGVIQSDHPETDWSRPVQVASVQTLARRGYPKANLVIVDECHRQFETINKWLHHSDWQRVPFIGLSATPWSQGLGNHYDDLIISQTTQQLIDAGYLSRYRVFAPSHPDLSGVQIQRGDYVESQLSDVMSKAGLVADVVETWIRNGENRPTLCFAVDCAHAKHLQQRFAQSGIDCGYQDAFTEAKERAEIKRDFHSGRLKVVCNVGTLTTGVDWDVRCIILARPTRSEILYVQIIGRGLRTADGKADCLILDHSDSTQRLGFVTDICHDHLPMGKERPPEKRIEALPKECPSCTYLMPPRVMQCPACGHTRKPPVSQVATKPGELVEVRGFQKQRQKDKTIELRGRSIPLAQFAGELMSYARLHGYKAGWAAHKYREAVGDWPSRGVPEIPASMEVISWIKSRAIAWAKARH
jgi:DNA repair protein RadD